MNKENKPFEKRRPVVTFCLMIVSMPLRAGLRAFVFMKLWAWFVVVAFNVSAISMATAFGISAIIAVLNPVAIDTKIETENVMAKWIGHNVGTVIGLSFVLFVGWLISHVGA